MTISDFYVNTGLKCAYSVLMSRNQLYLRKFQTSIWFYSNWANDIYIGSFDEEQEAARAVDEYLASIGYERRNFPEDEVEDLEDLGGDAVSSPQ